MSDFQRKIYKFTTPKLPSKSQQKESMEYGFNMKSAIDRIVTQTVNKIHNNEDVLNALKNFLEIIPGEYHNYATNKLESALSTAKIVDTTDVNRLKFILDTWRQLLKSAEKSEPQDLEKLFKQTEFIFIIILKTQSLMKEFINPKSSITIEKIINEAINEIILEKISQENEELDFPIQNIHELGSTLGYLQNSESIQDADKMLTYELRTTLEAKLREYNIITSNQ